VLVAEDVGEQQLRRQAVGFLGVLVEGMEGDLRGYRRDRFTAEERALAEMENRLSDLAHDEDEIKRRTEEVRKLASARARQLTRDRADGLSRKLIAEVTRLRKLLGEVDVAPLGPWGSDEMDKATHRLDDLGRMLEQGDLDEARAMAQEAEQSLGRLEAELRSEEQASRWGQRVRIGRQCELGLAREYLVDVPDRTFFGGPFDDAVRIHASNRA